MSGDLQLKQFIDRILRLKEEQDTISDDIKEVYAEMKAQGFDKTAAGSLVSELRKKGKDGTKFEEANAILELYRDAYERASSHTHAPARTREGVGAKLVVVAANETADPETGEIIETHGSDPANERGSDDVIASDAGVLARAASASAEHASDERSRADPHSTVATPPAIVEQPEAPNTSPATSGANPCVAHVDDFDPARDMPSFLRRTDKGAMSGVEA